MTNNNNSPFFSYNPYAFNGPTYWYRLHMERNECGGSRNSPINIETTDSCDGNNNGDYAFQSGSCSIRDLDFDLTNVGPKATFSYGSCSRDNTMTLSGRMYKAIQLHTHLGSEHRFDGVTLDGELHMVHQESSGGYWHAVLAVLLSANETAEDHAAFDKFLDQWEVAADGIFKSCSIHQKNRRRFIRQLQDNNNDNDEALDLYCDLLPSGSSFYHYFGSLTVPPCSEVVYWSVANIPLTISTSQLARLASLTLSYKDPITCLPATSASPATNTTNRPAQNLNGRSVLRVCQGERMK